MCTTMKMLNQEYSNNMGIEMKRLLASDTVTGTDLHKINNSNFLCVLDYQNTFPIVK